MMRGIDPETLAWWVGLTILGMLAIVSVIAVAVVIVKAIV